MAESTTNEDDEGMAQLASLIRQAVREELQKPLQDILRAVKVQVVEGLDVRDTEFALDMLPISSDTKRRDSTRSSTRNSTRNSTRTSTRNSISNSTRVEETDDGDLFLTRHVLSHRVSLHVADETGHKVKKKTEIVLPTIEESEKEKESNEEKWRYGLRPFAPRSIKCSALIKEESETALLGNDDDDDLWHTTRSNILYMDDFDGCHEDANMEGTTLEDFVQSAWLEQFSAFMVALNALAIGLETEYEATHVGEEFPMYFVVVDASFCVLFTLELLLKLAGLGCRVYFTGRNAVWQWFDFVVVSFQVADYLFQAMAFGGSSLNVTAFRIARILRLQRLLRLARIVRIVRLVRTFDLIDDLHKIISSIASALKPLFWALLILFIAMYVFSIFFTHLVIDKKKADADIQQHELETLDRFYGSLLRALLTMFECVSGGIYWEKAMSPLLNISPFVCLVFVFYIAFSCFAMLNVVTGLFLERAIIIAQEHDDDKLCAYLLNIFANADASGTGEISWVEFQSKLDTDEMKEYFKIIDIDISEAETIFILLDVDGSGSVDALEFVSGCLRLRGSAKAVELSLLLHETKTMNRWLRKHMEKLEEKTSWRSPVQRISTQQKNSLKYMMPKKTQVASPPESPRSSIAGYSPWNRAYSPSDSASPQSNG